MMSWATCSYWVLVYFPYTVYTIGISRSWVSVGSFYNPYMLPWKPDASRPAVTAPRDDAGNAPRAGWQINNAQVVFAIAQQATRLPLLHLLNSFLTLSYRLIKSDGMPWNQFSAFSGIACMIKHRIPKTIPIPCSLAFALWRLMHQGIYCLFFTILGPSPNIDLYIWVFGTSSFTCDAAVNVLLPASAKKVWKKNNADERWNLRSSCWRINFFHICYRMCVFHYI